MHGQSLVLCVVIPPVIITVHYVYDWPCCSPTQAVWLNLILVVAGTAVLFLLMLVDQADRLSLDQLPDNKSVIEESLKYFKLGKKLTKEKKELIKDFENTKIGDVKNPGNDDEFRKRLFSYALNAIETLPTEDRQALMLTEMDGLSREELASELGISLTAAKSRVHRARTKLRKTVEECCRLVTDPYGRVIDWKKRGTACREQKNSATWWRRAPVLRPAARSLTQRHRVQEVLHSRRLLPELPLPRAAKSPVQQTRRGQSTH